jgi:uncharacterized repeat protein (TIGR01451 family)
VQTPPIIRRSLEGFRTLALVVAFLLLPLPGAASVSVVPAGDVLPQLDEIPIHAKAAAALSAGSQQQFLIELTDPPAAVKWAASMADRTVSKEQAHSNAVSAVRTQRLRIAGAQDLLAARLAAAPILGHEIFRIGRALNAISIYADPSQLAALRRLPGVKAVHVVVPEIPLNATSVPFINAPQLWANTIGLPENITGAGIKIGIIDTGIDYQHPMFGGSGLLADYQANDRVTISPSLFPTAKVVGGTDFAGDAYVGTNAPTPDPNPTDCFGHGSHVAGTAAGFGVQSDGTTYPGPYGPSTPFSTLRIGPGVAPQALLYSLRIFGCSGSTGLTPQAIDWSIDPNGDDDFSDHLDVINMSLGSSYGGISDTSALAAENAALTGVIVVSAAGNAGDTYFIHGSPASSTRSISVAAVADAGIAGAVVQVNAPAGIVGNYNASPDAFGNGAPNPSGQTGSVVLVNAGTGVANQGCSALTNAAAVAGNIAIVFRGVCSFQTKAATAQAAGAIGVIVVNNVPGDPNVGPMGPDSLEPNISIPAVLISANDGATILGQTGVNATLAGVNSGDQIAVFSSRGPRNSTPPIVAKPDISAPGVNIPSTQSGMTCTTAAGGCITPTSNGIDAGGLSLVLSGTSMATPHVAGSAALMRQLHPDWSVEEIKALLMNGATHSVFLGPDGSGPRMGIGRAGVGRIDDANSAQATVTAFDNDVAGAVSLSFTQDVVGTQMQTKSVRVVNHGTSDQTFDLLSDIVDAATGVSFSLPSTVTVAAGSSTTFDVQMTAVADSMRHIRETSVASTQAAPAPLTSLGSLSRHYLNEAGGYITFSQGGTVKLRLPVYGAARPTSAMAAAGVIPTAGAPAGSTTISLGGTAVCTGTLTAGPVCSGLTPGVDEESLVSPFEFHGGNARETSLPGYANIRYVGVTYDASRNLVEFGVVTWEPWATPADVAFNISVTVGGATRVLFNSDPGNMASNLFGASATGQDAFITGIFNTATSGVSIGTFVNVASAANSDSRIFDNKAMILAATPASLGIASLSAPFSYSVQTCRGSDPLCFGGAVDSIPIPFVFIPNAKGLDFGSSVLSPDLNGATVPVTWNTANIATNGSHGALLIHHHNSAATAAQIVVLDTSSRADLAVTQTVDVPSPILGQNITFAVTVTNTGPNPDSAIKVVDLLPTGVTYVSDDGAGAYDSSTGVWTVPVALAVSTAATLHITATVETTDPVTNTAQVSASSLVDTNPANDKASVTVSAPRSADVAVTMMASPSVAHVGDPVTYTITLTNHGGDVAYSLHINDSFPSFSTLTATSSTASAGVFNAATGLWNVPSLAKGATETLAMTFTVPNTVGSLSNTGSISSASTSDPNTTNNSANASVNIVSPAAVTGTKTVAGSFLPGGTVTYTVVLTNNGTFAQLDNPGDEFDDVLPASLALQSASATSGTASANLGTNTVSWNGTIAGEGGSVTIMITATVGSMAGGTTISNQGTIHFDADGNGTNESTSQTGNGSGPGATSFQVLSPSSVSGVKTVAGNFEEAGLVTYTIVLTNSGGAPQADNPGDEFDDVLPAGLILQTATATSGTPTADTTTNTVSWNGSIAAGGTVTMTVTARIATGTAGETLSNQGTIHFDADGNGTNEATASTTNGSGGGATTFEVEAIGEVPTLDATGLVLLALLLAGGALWVFKKRSLRAER